MKEVGYLCMNCRVYSVVLQEDQEVKKGKKCPTCKKPMQKMEELDSDVQPK